MKIKIEDGLSTVEFKKSEETALRTAVELCGQLGEWLKDELARSVALELHTVIEHYIPKEDPFADVLPPA